MPSPVPNLLGLLSAASRPGADWFFRAAKYALLALYLSDVHHVYQHTASYYVDDQPERTSTAATLAEDKRILAQYEDDCGEKSVLDKATYEAALADLGKELASTDAKQGLFSPDETTVMVMRESVAFLGGGRAAFMQLSHPFVAQGIRVHSALEYGVRQRFVRTFKFMFGMSFGTREEMFRASRAVRALHDRVQGTIDESGANLVFAQDSKFDAAQVHAVKWVGATLVETMVYQYEMLVRNLSGAEKDAMVQGGNKILRLFGVLPSAADPQTWAEFRCFMSAMWRSPVCQVSRTAKETAEFLLLPPSVLNQPLLDLIFWNTFCSLPPKIARQFYGRDVSWMDYVLYAFWNGLVRFVYRLLPLSFRRLSAYMRYEDRVGGGLWFYERWLGAASARIVNRVLDTAMPPRDPVVAREQVKAKMEKKWQV
jgi:uncharacterized protein (DUF2236 family)